MPGIYPDRLVILSGTVEQMAAAEKLVSGKIRECKEQENDSGEVYIYQTTLLARRILMVVCMT